MYQNMKIEITDEVQLKAVCEVLESLGYENEMTTTRKSKSICTYDDGTYDIYELEVGRKIGYLVNLTDLLTLRDKQFMESCNENPN